MNTPVYALATAKDIPWHLVAAEKFPIFMISTTEDISFIFLVILLLLKVIAFVVSRWQIMHRYNIFILSNATDSIRSKFPRMLRDHGLQIK